MYITIKCNHCNTEHIITPDEMQELSVCGKSVVNCENCDKLYTIRQDDEVLYVS